MVLDSKAAVGGGYGGGGAVVVVDDDMGDGMQCTDHPFRSSSPGGICAFCLQDKLGKLVSSSSSSFYVGSSSSSSPSFRSDLPTTRLNSSSSLSLRPSTTAVAAASSSTTTTTTTTTSLNNTSNVDENSNCGHGSRYQEGYYTSTTRRARIPFLLTQKKKKKTLMSGSASTTTSSTSSEMVLKRSKSTATPRSGRYFPSDADDFSPRRRGFWSFLHLTNHKKPSDRSIKIGPGPIPNPTPNPGPSQGPSAVETKKVEYVIVDEGTDSSPNSSAGGSSSNNNNNNNTASFGRKVSRSRSVGCGSRSFSGDFFERISTGFGDCTLRRVESQREGKRASSASRASVADPMKERVRCGGLFGGFMMITSSSSSSSSSSYWTSVADDHGRPNGPAATPGAGPLVHGRSRTWGWAFASPMRAFQKPTTTIIKDGKRDLSGEKDGESNGKSASTPNLAAIPSLLAVRG